MVSVVPADHTAAPAPGRARILDIEIELDAPPAMLDRVCDWAASARDRPAGRPARRVMYANAHVLNQTRSMPGLRAILRSSDLVYCDGYGVRLAARALEAEVPHRMTGADWIWDLAERCRRRDLGLYLLGAEPGVAARAASVLQLRHPGLRVVGTHHGFFGAGTPHERRVLEDLERTRPDIVLVGMGSPLQELWTDRRAEDVPAGVLWTVGALFDYVSGMVPRAPNWLADNGWEWVFRLAVEPRRMWRRYLLGNPAFLARVLAQARREP